MKAPSRKIFNNFPAFVLGISMVWALITVFNIAITAIVRKEKKINICTPFFSDYF